MRPPIAPADLTPKQKRLYDIKCNDAQRLHVPVAERE